MLSVVARAALVIFALIAFTGRRWAYAIYLALALLFIPARVGFHLHAPPCETAVTIASALVSLHNVAHMVLFGIFAIMTAAQLRGRTPTRMAAIVPYVMLIGLLIELEEGATGTGHCRMRDLIPDGVGAAIALSMLWLGLVLRHRAALSGTSLRVRRELPREDPAARR